MDLVRKGLLHFARKDTGQTSVEYLLLMATAFLVSYLIITGPMANFTKQMLTDIREGIGNAVTHAEWTKDRFERGKDKHPGNPKRVRPIHL